MADQNLNMYEITEKAFIQAIVESEGNVSAAARKLGISRSTVNEWIKDSKKFQRIIEKARFKRRHRVDPEDLD